MPQATIMRRVRDLLTESPELWIQDASFHRLPDGRTQCCVLNHMHPQLGENLNQYYDEYNAISTVVGRRGDGEEWGVGAYNDDSRTTLTDILSLLDEAIKLYEEGA